MKFEEIISSLQKKDYHPVYFLMGEESFYIDKISDFITKNVLDKSEKDFNQHVFYGKDSEVSTILSAAKQFPLMGKYNVVIVKEAQELKNIELLDSYINQPLDSTILVICYKNKSIDKRKKFGKELAKKTFLFESKKLYENQIVDWIQKYVSQHLYKIDVKAALLLGEYTGTSLSKLSNELDKLMIILQKGETITREIIERNIGISKDYNVFELNNALSKKDILKANRIVNYFGDNSKDHPLVVTVASLFNHFQKILIYHTLDDKSKSNVASQLRINPFFVSDYVLASRNFNKKQLLKIFSLLRIYDLKSKGVNNSSSNDGQLLKELIFQILH